MDGPSLQLLLAAIYSKRLPLTADGVSQDIPRLLAASNYLEVGAGRGRIALFHPCLASRAAVTLVATQTCMHVLPTSVLPWYHGRCCL